MQDLSAFVDRESGGEPGAALATEPAGGDSWSIGGIVLRSRFFLGTGQLPSPAVMQQALQRSGAEGSDVCGTQSQSGGAG